MLRECSDASRSGIFMPLKATNSTHQQRHYRDCCISTDVQSKLVCCICTASLLRKDPNRCTEVLKIYWIYESTVITKLVYIWKRNKRDLLTGLQTSLYPFLCACCCPSWATWSEYQFRQFRPSIKFCSRARSAFKIVTSSFRLGWLIMKSLRSSRLWS